MSKNKQVFLIIAGLVGVGYFILKPSNSVLIDNNPSVQKIPTNPETELQNTNLDNGFKAVYNNVFPPLELGDLILGNDTYYTPNTSPQAPTTNNGGAGQVDFNGVWIIEPYQEFMTNYSLTNFQSNRLASSHKAIAAAVNSAILHNTVH